MIDLLLRRGMMSIPQNGEGTYLYYTSTNNNIVDIDDSNCNTKLKSNTYENNQGVAIFKGILNTFGYGMFRDSTNLYTIIIPDTVTSFEDYVFTNTGLVTFTIPSTITSIGSYLFYGCTNLTSVTIPGNFSTLPNSMFCECTSLTSVNIPSTVYRLNSNFMKGCSALTTITLPSSINWISTKCFSECNSLTTFNYLGTISQWNNVFKDNYWKYNAPFTVVHCSDGDVSV